MAPGLCGRLSEWLEWRSGEGGESIGERAVGERGKMGTEGKAANALKRKVFISDVTCKKKRQGRKGLPVRSPEIP